MSPKPTIDGLKAAVCFAETIKGATPSDVIGIAGAFDAYLAGTIEVVPVEATSDKLQVAVSLNSDSEPENPGPNYGNSNENLFTLRDVQCAALVYRKFVQFYARDRERARWMQYSYPALSACVGLSEQQIARAYEVLRQCELIETAPIGHVYLVDYPNGIPDAKPEGDA